MAIVLTASWFAQMNARLAAAAHTAPSAPEGTVRVAFELTGAPDGEPEVVTFLLSAGVATMTPGREEPADVTVRLTFEDASALVHGTVSGGQVLRDGRLKVRGDTDALNHFGAWIVAAQIASSEPPS